MSVPRQIAIAVVAAGVALMLARGVAGLVADPVIGSLSHLFDLRQDLRVAALVVGLAVLVGCGIGPTRSETFLTQETMFV